MTRGQNVGVALAKLVWQRPHRPYDVLHPCSRPIQGAEAIVSTQNDSFGVMQAPFHTLGVGTLDGPALLCGPQRPGALNNPGALSLTGAPVPSVASAPSTTHDTRALDGPAPSVT